MMDPSKMDPKTTIFPTFECFTEALELVAYLSRIPDVINYITLVHGICLAENGREFAHAWVEDSNDETVIFCGVYMGKKVYLSAPFKNYFETFKVKETTRYTVPEALWRNLETVSYGPWEDKYKALCGNGEQTILGGGHMEGVSMIGSLPFATTPTPKQLKRGKK